MAKVLKIAAIVVGVAALAIVTGGAAVGLGLSLGTSVLGVSAGTLLLAGSVISLGASLLSPKPSAPTLPSDQTNRLSVSIDLRTGRKMAIGSTAIGTDLRDQEWSTDQAFLHRWIVSASHRVAAIREIWFDDKLAWTSAGGVQGEYAGYLAVTPVLEGSAANAINTGPRMGTSRRFTGCAYVYLRYKLTGNDSKAQSPFASAIPSRMTIIGDGIPVYDPRLDSTAGGSGPQRANDQTTWQWTASAGRNPSLGLLAYMLGWRIQNPATGEWKLAVGKGIAPARINIASFITTANICDEQVAIAGGGSEPRYRADGLLSENDDLTRVADNFKAAMNGVLDDVDGQFRLSILHNDLAAPIGSLTTADVLGEFRWDQTPALQDTINVIRWSYTDPSTTSLYQMVDGPEVTIASPDGIERSQTVPLALVQSPSQGQRLIKLRLQRALYPGSFQATFQATAWKFQKGDVIRFSFAPLGFGQKLFRISDLTIQVDGTVPMSLREEHPDIYLAENDANAAIVGTAPTVYNPLLTPILQDLSNLNDVLDRVSSDGWLSGVEKRQVVIDRSALGSDLAALYARYVALSSPADITPAYNAAVAKVGALDTYLAGLAPAWNDPAFDTRIDPAAYRTAWTQAYNAVATFSATVTGRPGADGRDGLNGSNGAPGAAGADGRTTYLHTAYSDAPDGSVNFTTGAPGTRKYLGVLVDFTPADSASSAAYDWSLIKGSDGLNGSNGTPGAPGANGQPTYVHIAYSNAPDGSVNFSVDNPAVRTYVGFYVDQTVADSTNPGAYSWSLVKGADGANGANGVDSFTMTLASDSVQIACDYLGKAKANELPKYVAATIYRGTVDVTNQCTTRITGDGGHAGADSSGHTTRIYEISGDGYLLITASYGGVDIGTRRLAVTQKLDAPPPASVTGSSGVFENSVTSTTYDGSGVSTKSIVLTTGPSGNLTASGGGQYRAPYNPNANTLVQIAGKIQYRPVGSSGWSDAGAEVVADAAQYFANDGPNPSQIYFPTTAINGLSASSNYEIRINCRIVSAQNANGTAVQGGTMTGAQA